MSRHDTELARQLNEGIREFETTRHLPGIQSDIAREVFVRQLVDSIHRTEYPGRLLKRDVSANRCDPQHTLYDPIRAAVWFSRNDELDEAFWQVFLFVHFGLDRNGEWGYAKAVYGRLGEDPKWNWENVSRSPTSFRHWLAAHSDAVRQSGAGFGNHRKYQSLKAYGERGTGAAFASYVEWIGPRRSHVQHVDGALGASGGDPKRAFRQLYESMTSQVAEFGRTAALDYLAMLGKLELAAIAPDSTYIQGSTGPIRGANLLFAGTKDAGVPASVLDAWLLELDEIIHTGPQALEDAICNWQKSPRAYVRFSG